MKKITRAQFLSYSGLTILGGLLLSLIGLSLEEIFSNEAEKPAEPHRRKWTVFGADIKPVDAYKAIAQEWGYAYKQEASSPFKYILNNGKITFYFDDEHFEDALQFFAHKENLELLLNQTTFKVGNRIETVPAYHYLGERA